MQKRIPAVLAATAAVVAITASMGAPAFAEGASTYTVTVGGTGTWSNPDDTPASPFIDKDGTFYYEEAHSLYGASDPRAWSVYTGTTIDNATADASKTNTDTTAMCNNSPTGLEATSAPTGSSYSQPNYCDITGIWIDPDTGDWYGLVHNEFTPQPFGDGLHYDSIDYAVSTDQGTSWTIKDHAITSPYSTTRGDTTAFPGQTYYYGDGDPRLFVDTASGYFYVYYGSRVIDKTGSWKAFYEHVARAPIADKMAPDSWRKWYDGSWSQPGVGGKESNITPVTASDPTGYTDPAKEYNPANTGTADQQIAAGTMPATSPLFVMDITYDAYLGLYIGEPQALSRADDAPQQYYATDNLATQKWTLIGDTGTYHTASWYRWFMDSANATSSAVVGKSFRDYCSFNCQNAADSEYANVTINSTSPAAPVKDGATYQIASSDGRALAQTDQTKDTASTPDASPETNWTFTATGDGAYTIANAKTGDLLGVDSTSTANRAWGTKPVASPAAGTHGAASVGQQWFLIPNTSATTGAQTGTFRLVNRYSGLALSLSSDAARSAETAPGRTWTAAASSVGAGRTAGEQTISLKPAFNPTPTPTPPSPVPTPTPTASGTLPNTGIDIGSALAGLAVIALGLVLMCYRRRARQH